MSTVGALAGTEARLLSREWGAMVFGFVFPTLFMLVLAGVFANDDPSTYGGVSGTDYYLSAYAGVPVGAMAFVGLPVMLASYRERGVLRRFDAFGVSTVRVVAAQVLVTFGMAVLGTVVEMAVALPLYGLPPIDNVPATLVGYVMGAATMLSLGAALGLAAKTARSASALGMVVFLPMWLLGGGGPPQSVMTGAMQQISDVLPLWHTTVAIRQPWLFDAGFGHHHILALTIWLAVGLAAIALLLRRRS
ncbi:MAG: ABC transporter permease [Nocardioidaceae bacterium]